MRMYGICLLLVLMVFTMTGCTFDQKESDEVTTTFDQIESTESVIDREQRVIFNCYATDGLAAYALTKMIYEQPILNENANLEYTIFSDLERFDHVASKAERAILVLPSYEAVQLLQTQDQYNIVGIVQVDGEALALMLLITKDILEDTPEIAKAFEGEIATACEWNTHQKQRALAYAEQLKIHSDLNDRTPEKMLYETAYDGISMIEELLQSELYEDVDVDRVLESISRYF